MPTPVENGELAFFKQSKNEASQSQCDLYNIIKRNENKLIIFIENYESLIAFT